MIHYKDKRSDKYPIALCGHNAFHMRKTEDADKVTCKTCLRGIEKLKGNNPDSRRKNKLGTGDHGAIKE